MRNTSKNFKQSGRQNRFGGNPDRSIYKERRDLSSKNSNYKTLYPEDSKDGGFYNT